MLVVLLAQAAPQAEPPRQPPSDEVVVSGLRDIDQAGSPVSHRTLGSSRVGVGARRGLQVFQAAQRFATCAVTDDPPNLDRLRRALDGVVNGAGQRFWQSRFIQQKSTCAQDVGIAQRLGVAVVTTDYDPSYYERGALFLRAIQRFAPDLRLTPKETGDPAVQARFNARETPLARYRLPVDRDYFQTAVCLVRLQPQLAVSLMRTEDNDQIARIEAAIVDRAPICTGNARQVYFDPSQFRFYMADAVYRWAVAARGATTLIPSERSPRGG